MLDTHCSSCGHQHTSVNLAHICIGCPCPHTPIAIHFDGHPLDCEECNVPWPCPTFRGEQP